MEVASGSNDIVSHCFYTGSVDLFEYIFLHVLSAFRTISRDFYFQKIFFTNYCHFSGKLFTSLLWKSTLRAINIC